MIKITDRPETKIVQTTATGKLTKEDYEKLIPVLEEKIDKWGKIRWYFEMQDFDSWSGPALWEDLKFDVRHANDFEKIAMVGEKKWHDKMTQLIKPFTNADVKYFDETEKKRAEAWIEEA